jgi:flagellar assembly protein FliH
MNGESMTGERRGIAGRPFRYPEAPWEPGPAASGGLFRELGAQRAVSRNGAAGVAVEEEEALAGEESSVDVAQVSVPLRYEYRIEPGFEAEMEDEETEQADPTCSGGAVGDRERVSPSATQEERDRHFRELLASECARAEENGRRLGMEAGRMQGRKEGREEATEQLRCGAEAERKRLAEQTAALLRGFDVAREADIERLQEESARLALAIAARILRREAETDPLLLTRAVRVALGQLAASKAVRLRVPAENLALWQEALTHLPNLALRPEVVGDAELAAGDCRVETELGNADLGIDAQIEVLERVFFASGGRRTADDWQRLVRSET